MADTSAAVDTLLHLTQTLSASLPHLDDPFARQLHLSILRLDHCLVAIRKSASSPTAPSLLWIDDVIASLHSLSRHLQPSPPPNFNNSTITTSSSTHHTSNMHRSSSSRIHHHNNIQHPSSRRSRYNTNSRRRPPVQPSKQQQVPSPPTNPAFHYDRRHTHIGDPGAAARPSNTTTTSNNQHHNRRRTLASLFSSSPNNGKNINHNVHNHNHLSTTTTTAIPPPPRHTSLNTSHSVLPILPNRRSHTHNDFTRSFPSLLLNNPFSERLFSSFARLNLSSSPAIPTSPTTPTSPHHHHTNNSTQFPSSSNLSPSSHPSPTPTTHHLASASRTVDEWVTAISAAKDDRLHYDDIDSCVSISDALPKLPQNYYRCRDTLYETTRDILLKASIRAAPPSSASASSSSTSTSHEQQQQQHHFQPQSRSPVAAVALYGPHGVGKTMLAMELVNDVDICHNFADGVAWIQLGPDVTDEELAENIIRCVDTIIASDFRTMVKYYNSVDAIVAHAARLLSRTASLVVIDDVSGPKAQRAFDLVTSALGPSCVALYTAPCTTGDEDYENDDNDNDNDIQQQHTSTGDLNNNTVPLHSYEIPTSTHISIVAKIPVPRLDPTGAESLSVFRNWLTKSTSDESRTATHKHVSDQTTILHNCYGLPLALAMCGGFLSRFYNSWNALATALCTSRHADDSIFRILRLLHVKGGARFDQQLKAIGSLPQGMWVSLSVLADVWETDYKTIDASARRLGRIAFGEYRLSDTADESRVKFHFHVVKYCENITTERDLRDATRRLITNVARRRKGVNNMNSNNMRRNNSRNNELLLDVNNEKARRYIDDDDDNCNDNGKNNKKNKIQYLPWWNGILTDKYLCRRLHWHLSRHLSPHASNTSMTSSTTTTTTTTMSNASDFSNSYSYHHAHSLMDLICDFQWVTARVTADGLLGIMSEFKEAMLLADRRGLDHEFTGIGRVASAVQEASRMLQDDMIELNVWPTFLHSVLRPFQAQSNAVRDFLSSMYDKAHRPWLKPLPRIVTTALPRAERGPRQRMRRGGRLTVGDDDGDEMEMEMEMEEEVGEYGEEGEGEEETTRVEDEDENEDEDDANSSNSSGEEFVTHCLASSASGKVIVGDNFGNVHVYDPATGNKVISWVGTSLPMPIVSTLPANDSDLEDSDQDGIRPTATSAVAEDPSWRGVGALTTIHDYVISGHYNGLLILRSIRSGRWEVLQRAVNPHTTLPERYSCLAAHDDGVVVAGTQSGAIFILKGVHGTSSSAHNCAVGSSQQQQQHRRKRVRRIDLEGHCDMVTALYIFPDRDRVASSSYDGFAAIWKLSSSSSSSRKNGTSGGGYERISLNGHKPDCGHKENFISTFASVDNGKKLLSACRGGIVSAWNSRTGDCLWTRRYGYEFSRSCALQAFGSGLVGDFASQVSVSVSVSDKSVGEEEDVEEEEAVEEEEEEDVVVEVECERRRYTRMVKRKSLRGLGGKKNKAAGAERRAQLAADVRQRDGQGEGQDEEQERRVRKMKKRKENNSIKVGFPYLVTRGDGPNDLMIVCAGEGRDVVGCIATDEVISSWLEVWHRSSRRVYVAVSHADGKLACYELVTSLR